MSSRTPVLAALVVLLAVSACSKDSKKGPLVAKGKGVAVTAEEFKAKLEEQAPFIRARYATLDRKKEFLENLVRFELLAAEAKRRDLDRDPEVQAALQKIMVQKLVRSAFEEKAGAEVSEADARSYYDEHQEEFVKPERVRLALVFFRAEAGTPERTAKSAEARRQLGLLKQQAARNPLAFGNLARDASDDSASKAAGGDIGFRSREELEKLYSKSVSDAAFALAEVGQVSGVVEAPQGLYLLKLGARQPATSREFEEAKPQITARLGRERRTKEHDDFVKRLRDEADVEIIDAELDKITVSAAAPGLAPAQPAPQLGGAGR